MENFEAGVACCWSGHKFVAGERGRKCLTCGKVMTNQAWEEKRKCFSGHTNIVLATAINPNVSRLTRPITRLEWRDPPLVSARPRRKLKWRDARTTKWKIIAISAIVLLVLFVIIFIVKR